MTEGLDLELARSGSLVKKGYSFLVSNVGKTVAAITLSVAALVSFTEISLSGISAEGFTSTLALMLIASYVMYFSLNDAGARLGRESDEHKAASERLANLQQRLRERDIASLRSFCLEYTNRELEYRRDSLLFSLGYTKEEYEAYLRGEKMPKSVEKALRRVKKIKRAELDTGMLLSSGQCRGSELESPEKSRLLSTARRLVPSTVCMLFTVSVMVSVKDDMTAAGVIEAVLKLSTLPIVGLKGYSAGYEYAMGTEIAWIQTRLRIIEEFLKRE